VSPYYFAVLFVRNFLRKKIEIKLHQFFLGLVSLTKKVKIIFDLLQ